MSPYGPQVVTPGRVLTYERDGITVSAGSRLELIRVFTEALQANGRRVEGIEAEIDRYLAGIGFGVPITTDSIAEKPRGAPTLIQRVHSWLRNRFTQFGTIKFVTADEARSRAAICIQCRENKKWTCPGCGQKPNEDIESDVLRLLGGRTTPLSRRLHACRISGQENRVAIFLETEFLPHRKQHLDKLPGHCWLKHL